MKSEIVWKSDGLGVATFAGRRNGSGNGQIYRLNPPYWNEDDRGGVRRVEHVWVSATVVPGTGPETFIFASDEDGGVTDWLELPGSFQGDLDHGLALEGLGYEVR